MFSYLNECRKKYDERQPYSLAFIKLQKSYFGDHRIKRIRQTFSIYILPSVLRSAALLKVW